MRHPARSATKLAAKLLGAGRDDMEFLREHDFKDDAAQHDDELHERLRAEFSADVDRVKEELSRTYGKPFRIGAADNRLVPFHGVVRYAVWQVGEQRLYVAASRAERETPFLLALGVVAGRDA